MLLMVHCDMLSQGSRSVVHHTNYNSLARPGCQMSKPSKKGANRHCTYNIHMAQGFQTYSKIHSCMKTHPLKTWQECATGCITVMLHHLATQHLLVEVSISCRLGLRQVDVIGDGLLSLLGLPLSQQLLLKDAAGLGSFLSLHGKTEQVHRNTAIRPG